MRATSLDNSQDIIDSRDVIARIADLESDRDALTDTLTEAQDALTEAQEARNDLEEAQDAVAQAASDVSDWDESDDGQELKALRALEEQAQGYCDWRHGEALIRDSYFQTYAEELADDIGAIDKNATWPVNCIDWEEAADQLKADYTEVEFDGVAYWVRS